MRDQDKFDCQVRTLVAFVRRLEATNGYDLDAKNYVRNFVTGELLNERRLEVTAKAIGELSESESLLLINLINLYGTTFYKNGWVFSAVAVPVSLLWKSRQTRTYSLNRGSCESLASLAKSVKEHTGAASVIIDNHLYTARELFRASPRALFSRLQSLIAGVYNFKDHPFPSSLKSQLDDAWSMRYFLGVEIQQAEAERVLNNSDVQHAMKEHLYLGVAAAIENKNKKIVDSKDRTAICHGVLYLNEAIQLGERLIREYQLKSMLESVADGARQVDVKYYCNPLSDHIALLVSSDWLTLKFRWNTFAGESLQHFHKALRWAAQSSMEKCDEFSIEEVESEEFERALDVSGLVWMKGMK